MEFLNWRGEGAELFYWRKKNNLKSAHTKIFIFFSNDLKLYLKRKKRGQGLWCLTPLATLFQLCHGRIFFFKSLEKRVFDKHIGVEKLNYFVYIFNFIFRLLVC